MIRRIKVWLLCGFCLAMALLLRASAQATQQVPAERVYKNIEALKGIAASELPNLMIAYGSALGVTCEYCHVPGAFEKSDKPAHKAALRDIQMTRDLNSRYKIAVDCMSCHHGATKPTSVGSTQTGATVSTPSTSTGSTVARTTTEETAPAPPPAPPARTREDKPSAKSTEPAGAGGSPPGKVSFKASYGAVAFDHDQHSSAFDCTICHHTGADNLQKCSACHLKSAGSITRVTAKDAAHGTKSQRSCAGCHLSSGSGPTKCAECHKR
jgi:hypothetical protein